MRKPVAAAVALFSLSLILLWRARPDGDVVEFSRYGHAVLDGQVPYRDFALEYPPGAIAAFTPPAFGEYVTIFVTADHERMSGCQHLSFALQASPGADKAEAKCVGFENVSGDLHHFDSPEYQQANCELFNHSS